MQPRGEDREKEVSMKLFWNEGGEIACAAHMPFAGSDTHAAGRWRVITTNDRIDFAAEVGHAPACATCAAIARRHGEGAHVERRSNECAMCAGAVA
jgi:hypothetical protein